jgi:hypothetical protein
VAEFLSKRGQTAFAHGGFDRAVSDGLRRTVDVGAGASIQAVLDLSAQAGQAACWGGGLIWPSIRNRDVQRRRISSETARLRPKGPGTGNEVGVPAYTAMQDPPRLGARMLNILMRDVPTVNTGGVIPEMADTDGPAATAA